MGFQNKYRKASKFLLFTIICFLVTPSSTIGSHDVASNNLPPRAEPIDHNLGFTATQAEKLCTLVRHSMVNNDATFLWTRINKMGDELEDGQAGNSDNGNDKTEVSPAEHKSPCMKWKWTPCEGEIQFPVHPLCGLFTLVQEDSEDCQDKNQKPKSRLIDHDTAMHLCVAVNRAPKVTGLVPKFAPIRILLDPKPEPHISQECISWAWNDCAKSGSRETKNGCQQGWTKVVSTKPDCDVFAQFEIFRNSSEFHEMKHMVKDKIDFVEGSASNTAGSHLYRHLYNLVQCQLGINDKVRCLIVPPKSRRKREGVTSSPIVRTQRRDCGLFRCDYGRDRDYARQIPCNCGGPNCACCGFCRKKNDPYNLENRAGCYLNCNSG